MRTRTAALATILVTALAGALAGPAASPAASAADSVGRDVTVHRWDDPRVDWQEYIPVSRVTLRKMELHRVTLRVVRDGPRPAVRVDYRIGGFIGHTRHDLRQFFMVQLWVNDHDDDYRYDRYLDFETTTDRGRPIVEIEDETQDIVRVPCADARQDRVEPGHFRMSVPLQCLTRHGFTSGSFYAMTSLIGQPEDVDRGGEPGRTYAFDLADDGRPGGRDRRTDEISWSPSEG